MTDPRATFLGRPSKTERLFEAHLFLTCKPDEVDTVMELARRRRFRRSSRLKELESGNHDVLLTRNSDSEELVTGQLRALADELVRAGVYVYRVRLERMVFDEVRATR